MTLLDTVRPSIRDGDVTVLVAGVGTLGASGILKALRQTDAFDAHIVGVDANPNARGFSLVDTAATVSQDEPEALVAELFEIAWRENVDVVFPLGTEFLRPLSESKQTFESEGIQVMVADPRALGIARDTGRLYGELVKRGHPATPEFYRVSTHEEFVDAVHALGYPDRCVCFKPPTSTDLSCLHILDPEIDRFNALLNKQSNSIRTTLDGVLPAFAETAEFPDLVVTEDLRGEKYSVDALVRADEEPILVTRLHTETDENRSFTGTVEEDFELMEYSREICDLVGLEYNATLRFKRSADGTPKLLGIHPRISKSITACVGAGANIPALSVQYALGRELPDVDVEWGTHVTRDWQDVFYGPDREPSTI
ncbi:ATP-grasp domain-containing protein [Halobellus rufus]|uniref:ATP-grasp domain-containing protein n=1 Tax=Halobellus rufus TaxID=1448860 RepID=UPI000A5BFFE3|nr:ATP-grasp domain-containing protein [Halobellus rufus]